MAEADWAVNRDAIVERPRDVRRHPLLERVYRRHDELIARHLPAGTVLEVAFGQYMHPSADVGLEAWPPNARGATEPACAGDARSLPFRSDRFDAVIGRRFLHHVPAADRRDIVAELSRILAPGGRCLLLEGTPGLYRRLAKGLAFRLGALETDTDLYGHLSRPALRDLVASEFEVVVDEPLGSPLLVAAASTSAFAERLFPLYERTQVVDWWTLVVGEPRSDSVSGSA